MKVYIVIWAEGLIQSVWSQKLLAQNAIKEHAAAKGWQPKFYKIIIRELDELDYGKLKYDQGTETADSPAEDNQGGA